MNLLIVDDEYYTVESISNKIRTLRPDFFEIFCAYNLTQALEAFSAHPIDLMICDIEMPGGSGLELLDQIRQAHYETVCIFLTAYAKFEYISRAMKLSSSDYLLKPLDDHALLEALDKACAQCEKQQKDHVNTLHANYWKESELPLAEQFFLDLLNGSISSAPSEVMDEIRYRRLNVELIHQPLCPLLIQTGQTNSFSPTDNRTLYEFALKNIAREYFFEPGELPLTIRVLDGFYLLLLPASTHSRDAVIGRCRQALTDFVTHFPFSINFFVDQKVCLPEDLRKAFLSMKAFAGKNVTYENHVFDLAAETEAPVQTPFQPIPSDRWSDLLTSGRTEQLQIEVFAFLNQTKSFRHCYTGISDRLLLSVPAAAVSPDGSSGQRRRSLPPPDYRCFPGADLLLVWCFTRMDFQQSSAVHTKPSGSRFPGHGCCHREGIYRIAPLRRAGSRYACGHGIPERRLSVPSLQKRHGKFSHQLHHRPPDCSLQGASRKGRNEHPRHCHHLRLPEYFVLLPPV